jgi:phosphate transport system substrate-binding protein
MAVRRELVKSGVVLRDVRGFGAQMPVAANTRMRADQESAG